MMMGDGSSVDFSSQFRIFLNILKNTLTQGNWSCLLLLLLPTISTAISAKSTA